MRWEHKVILFEGSVVRSQAGSVDKLYAQVEQLGDEGWELVSVTPIQEELGATTAVLWSFKRPRPQD